MKNKLPFLMLNVFFVLISISGLNKGIDSGEVWRIVLASIGMLTFSLFSVILLLRKKKEINS